MAADLLVFCETPHVLGPKLAGVYGGRHEGGQAGHYCRLSFLTADGMRKALRNLVDDGYMAQSAVAFRQQNAKYLAERGQVKPPV